MLITSIQNLFLCDLSYLTQTLRLQNITMVLDRPRLCLLVYAEFKIILSIQVLLYTKILVLRKNKEYVIKSLLFSLFITQGEQGTYT